MKTRLKPKFIINGKGKKTSVIVDIKEYENLLEYLEDLEDANDLLKAEREATSHMRHFAKTCLKA
jgi:hypothetical protein